MDAGDRSEWTGKPYNMNQFINVLTALLAELQPPALAA